LKAAAKADEESSVERQLFPCDRGAAVKNKSLQSGYKTMKKSEEKAKIPHCGQHSCPV